MEYKFDIQDIEEQYEDAKRNYYNGEVRPTDMAHLLHIIPVLLEEIRVLESNCDALFDMYKSAEADADGWREALEGELC